MSRFNLTAFSACIFQARRPPTTARASKRPLSLFIRKKREHLCTEKEKEVKNTKRGPITFSHYTIEKGYYDGIYMYIDRREEGHFLKRIKL